MTARAVRAGAVAAALAWAAAGCESAADKCAKARTAADEGWSGYLRSLEGIHHAAVAIQASTHSQLTGTVEKRLFPQAQTLADARYDRSSEAWLRAQKVAYNDLCGKDPECRDLRDRNTQATTMIADVEQRLPLVLAAKNATKADPGQAKQAAAAAITYPEDPQLKHAQELTGQLVERCTGLPAVAPEKDEAPR